MKKTDIAKILEWHNSGTLKTDEAVERICSLFGVVGRSEQLKAFFEFLEFRDYLNCDLTKADQIIKDHIESL